jgi:hypothetical protein
MIAIRLPRPRVNHALGAMAVVFAAFAAWPWLSPPVPTVRPLAAPPASSPAPRLMTLPPLAHYAAIVERPLFSPSRRPPSVAAASPSADGRYRLLGVVATGPRRKAFLADGSRHLDLAEGEAIDGWTVKKIGTDNVVLTSPTGDIVLKLKPAAAEPQKPQ